MAIKDVPHPPVYTSLGLNGNVYGVTEHRTGTPGNHVDQIDFGPLADLGVIAKYNDQDAGVITAEVRQHRRLEHSGIGHLLPRLLYTDGESAVYEVVSGHELRAGLVRGVLSYGEAMIALKTVVDAKAAWWAGQERQPGSFVEQTVQRKQRDDTKERLDREVGPRLSTALGIEISALSGKKLVVEGEELPSLQEVITAWKKTIYADPPYTLLVHGDATGSNILRNPQTQETKLIDAGFAGYSDPAEAMVRMFKWRTTALQKEISFEGVRETGNSIELSIHTRFLSAAENLHAYGENQVQRFAQALNDPDLPRRYYLALSGSYLREAVLSFERGNSDVQPAIAMWALVEAAKAYKHAQELGQSTRGRRTSHVA